MNNQHISKQFYWDTIVAIDKINVLFNNYGDSKLNVVLYVHMQNVNYSTSDTAVRTLSPWT